MAPRALIRRNLAYYWRAHLAVGLGAMTATATLTGALLVGDSMRAGLRQLALGRLGRVDYALTSHRWLREELASEIAASEGAASHVTGIAPIISLEAGASHADTQARVNRIQVLGVDSGFWPLAGGAVDDPGGRSVILNEPLAHELGATSGDDVLFRLAKPGDVSTETLFGRRDETALTLRLTVTKVLPREGAGGFSLQTGQKASRTAWVSLSTLQRQLHREGKVNTLLVEAQTSLPEGIEADLAWLQRTLQDRLVLQDAGLRLRVHAAMDYVSLESDALLIQPDFEAAAMASAKTLGSPSSAILTYLANEISVSPSGRPAAAIPYSVVTAIDPDSPIAASILLLNGGTASQLQPGQILLNEWAANDLDVKPGDPIALEYYVTGPFGRLDTHRETFVLHGVVRMNEAATDPGFAPDYEGITDAETLSGWNPPFPLDLKKIRPKDEEYWKRYRTAPKAFVSLADGQRLWVDNDRRWGRCTSVRFHLPPSSDIQTFAGNLEREIVKGLDARKLGLRFDPVRRQALAASKGSTDFGMLFLGFSFFLIASAVMLTALLFRLGVERRAGEIGILLATGYTPATVTGLLLVEGVVITVIACGFGLVAAIEYAWLMLAGLRSWWSAAVHAPFLRVHVSPFTLTLGFTASVLIALASIAWSMRRVVRRSTRSLLTGTTPRASAIPKAHNHRGSAVMLPGGALVASFALLLSSWFGGLPPPIAFFAGGAGLVLTLLSFLSLWLKEKDRAIIRRGGSHAWLRLGARNTSRYPGRSLLCAGLVASATFIIVGLGAFRLEPPGVISKTSGTGGFSLWAESVVPLPYDLDSAAGRESLGISPSVADALDGTTIVPFRLRGGDEGSCLSLYRPTDPRILGVTPAMIGRGGFAFAATLAETDDEKKNPWRLLERRFPGGIVPAIGDESAVKWQWYLDLGKDLIVTDEHDREVHVRFVAMLAGSVLQSEVMIAESRFVELFPSIAGHAFFLLDTPVERTRTVESALERELSHFAFDVASTSDRLAEYMAVQNTYLTTFQTLGGLGLILGTIGLAVVLLRNVWERRGELALLRALGFSRAALGWMVLAENMTLVVAGLVAGAIPALVAIAPQLLHHRNTIPWKSLGLTLTGVAVSGLLAGAIAIRPTLRAPLLRALRAE